MSAETTTEKTSGPVEVGIKTARFQWARIAAIVGVFLALGLVSARFYQNSFAGLWDREALDQAQVAMSVANGRGFTTRFVRPLNTAWVMEERTGVPELNHAPLYAYALATAFKLRTVSDQVAAWVSLGFLLATIVATGVLGRILFDWRTGLLAASAVGLSAPILRIGITGEHWTMAGLWFVLLLIAVARHHKAASDGRATAGLGWTAAAALCVALMYLTHHILAFLAIPVAVYFAVTGSRRRLHLVVFVVATLAMTGWWSYRNYSYTGFPVLGANAWDLVANTSVFPGDTLYRSADKEQAGVSTPLLFPVEHFSAFARKLIGGSSDMLGATAAILGFGTLAFALVGVLYKFRNPSANALRGLMYGALPLAVACFALFGVGTNAMVIFAPVVAVFAGAYLFLLIEARKLHVFFRRVLVGCFLLLVANQTIVPLLWSSRAETARQANTPAHSYFSLLNSRGLRVPLFTDVPWIAAWRCGSYVAWLPTKDEDFLPLAELGFPVRVIVLTPESDNYPPDEIWYVLHKVRLWREYLENPKEGIGRILEAARIKASDTTAAHRFMQRLRREFTVSSSLEGITILPQDPLSPDDVQVFTHETD